MKLYCLLGSSGMQQREALLKETKNSRKQKIQGNKNWISISIFLYTVYS